MNSAFSLPFRLLILLIPLSAVAAGPGPILRGGGFTVTPYDLDAMLQEGTPQARLKVLKDRKRLHELTRQLYLTQAMAHEAQEMHLADDPLSQAELRRLRDRYLLYKRLAALDAEPIEGLDALVRQTYETHKADYRIPEEVRVSHILIAVAKGKEKEALAEARKLRERLLKGVDFAALARQYSAEPLAKRTGGMLGWISHGQMVPAFEKAAFALKRPGDISPPVRTRFGYHLILLHERREGRQQTFDEVEGKIRARLEKQLKEARRKAHYDALMKKLAPRWDEQAFDAYVKDRMEGLAPAEPRP